MLKIPPEAKKARSNLINKQNQERMRRLQDGDTLCEKIDKEVAKQVDSKYIHLIQDSTYDLEFQNGIPLYVRRTNLLRS